MTNNVKNQQQQQNQTAEKGWIIKLSPIFGTLIPTSEHHSDGDGDHEQYVDISKFKNLELELQEIKARLQTAEITKMHLQNISHSINVPGKGILEQVTRLYETEKDPEIKNHWVVILDCAKALLDYSNDVHEFFTVNAGLTSIVLQAFNPKKLVEQSIAKAGAAALNKGIRLVSNIHYEMPEVVIGDSYRLQAILDQLISNSIKFTEEGMVVITANLFPARSSTATHDFDGLEQDGNRILQFMVHDTGIGISQEKQQDMCEELENFDSAMQYQELGLGLMCVKQLIHEMKGKIELSSEEGKTTTVECKIPVQLPNSTD